MLYTYSAIFLELITSMQISYISLLTTVSKVKPSYAFPTVSIKKKKNQRCINDYCDAKHSS